MIKDYYELLKQRLSTITELKEVNLYFGQLEQDGKVVLPIAPAALIEFPPMLFDDQLEGVQMTDLQFSVYTISEALWQDDRKILNADVMHLELCQKVHKALHRYGALLSDLPANAALAGTPNDCTIINRLRRVSFEPIQTPHSNLFANIQVFEGLFVDLTACTDLTPAIINQLGITAQVVSQL